jgi:4-amino-4-deoxy-L-arabinose transferase-like glycosyltransferase
MNFERWGWPLAVGLSVIFGLQVFFGSLDKSLTWDEPTYIAAGYVNWTKSDYRLLPDHPPLMRKLQALPLLALDVIAPPLSAVKWGKDPNPRASYGRAFFFSTDNDPLWLARWARLPVLLLGMALVLCVYGFAREFVRADAALLACGLAAFDPNLIAHAKLATGDLGCTSLMFAAIWTFWRWLQNPGARPAFVCGTVSAFALLSKYTALLLLPIDLMLVGVWVWQTSPKLDWAKRRGELAMMAGIGVVLINFAYGFGFHLDKYLMGILRIYPDLAPGYSFYFWGQISPEPFWYYGLASLAIKTPLSAWLLVVLAVPAIARSASARAAAMVCAVPIGLLLLVSFVDITAPGIRRILLVVPFLLVVAGLAIEQQGKAMIRGVAGLAALGSIVTALLIYPHHLSYMNRLFGGPDAGPLILDESNIDWGQDLPALARWQQEFIPGEKLSLYYFGNVDPAAYGVRAVPLDVKDFENPKPGFKAISAHYLAALRKQKATRGWDSDWLSDYEPIAKAGYSIFIYRFPAGTPAPERP